MSNHADLTNLLKQFSGQARILTIPRAYIDMLDGDHLAALFLSQTVFLSDRAADDDGWFAKSYADWTDEIGLSERQVRRVVDTLTAFGVTTKLRRSSGHSMAATLHYRVDMEVLTDCVVRFCRSRSDETSERRSDETSERSYRDESKERENSAPSLNSEDDDAIPDFVPPTARKVLTMPRPQPDGGARVYSLIEAWLDAWSINVQRYRDGAHKTQLKGARLLADMEATPDEITAMCAERREKGKQPNDALLIYLASDYAGWKQRAAPAAPSGFWGREFTE